MYEYRFLDFDTRLHRTGLAHLEDGSLEEEPEAQKNMPANDAAIEEPEDVEEYLAEHSQDCGFDGLYCSGPAFGNLASAILLAEQVWKRGRGNDDSSGGDQGLGENSSEVVQVPKTGSPGADL